MKTILVVLVCLISSTAIAGKPRLPYYIKSDTLNTSIPKGKTLITGTVYYWGSKDAGALVATCNSQHQTHTNAEGSFRILVPSIDSCIYVFKKFRSEVVIEPQDFKDQHHMTIDFFLEDNEDMIEVDKPVIYVYSPEKQDVEIEIKPKGEFTFTYPTYKESWSFSANQVGEIEMDGKQYPYLFWEAKQEGLYFLPGTDIMPNSYQVNAEEVIPFLEKELTKLGLNDREKTDFITFWGPRMVAHDVSLVQFFIDDDYSEQIAELNITPAPESSRRIYMIFSPLDSFLKGLKTSPGNYPKFERNGLTLIEWGGSQVEYKIEF